MIFKTIYYLFLQATQSTFPTSGYEPSYNPYRWNQNDNYYNYNSYTYAFNNFIGTFSSKFEFEKPGFKCDVIYTYYDRIP